jgi:hypothetical protein
MFKFQILKFQILKLQILPRESERADNNEGQGIVLQGMISEKEK